MGRPTVGAVIHGIHGTWTVIGAPSLEREGHLPVWKVLTRYEERKGECAVMPLTIPVG
jgi:hypothetical protein